MELEEATLDSHITYRDGLRLIKEIRAKYNTISAPKIELRPFTTETAISWVEMLMFKLKFYKFYKYKAITNVLWTVFVSLIKVRLMDKKNWKTTVGGIVFAVGTALSAIHDPSWVALVGQIMMASAAIFFGYHASDK